MEAGEIPAATTPSPISTHRPTHTSTIAHMHVFVRALLLCQFRHVHAARYPPHTHAHPTYTHTHTHTHTHTDRQTQRARIPALLGCCIEPAEARALRLRLPLAVLAAEAVRAAAAAAAAAEAARRCCCCSRSTARSKWGDASDCCWRCCCCW